MGSVGRVVLVGVVPLVLMGAAPGCGEDGEKVEKAQVRLHNDFNNPSMARQPPWTICQASYLGASFGRIPWGEQSGVQEVEPGLDFVLMVAAWDDPDCNPENCLPLASKNEEEVVEGQERTIALNLPNHQGPCPPEGVQPVPEAQYNRILQLWPQYNFKPYAQRTENPQCLD